MGHGGFANPPTGTRPVPSGGAGLGLAREGLPLHLHISAAAEQGSYASQERVTKMVLEGLHTARASTRTGNLLQGNSNDIGFRRGQFWSRTSR